MTRTLALVTSALVLSSGCLIRSNPATGRKGTGAPLRVRAEGGTDTVTTSEVVGSQTIHHDGGSLSTVDVYGNVSRDVRWQDYSYYEGSARIDEQDYYRFAGDRASFTRVQRYRDGGRTMQKLGLAIMAGALAIGGGLTALGIANDSTGLALGGVLGGILLFSPGAAFYGGGRGRMDDKVVDLDTAIEDADFVERCFNGQCTAGTEPGGRKYRDQIGATPEERAPGAGDAAAGEVSVPDERAERAALDDRLPPPSRPAQLGMRPAATSAGPPKPPPGRAPVVTKAPTSLVGTWSGTLAMTITQPGQSPSRQAEETTFEIEPAGPPGAYVFWANVNDKDARCKLTASGTLTRAQFKPQKVCTLTEDGQSTTISTRSGSLELRDGQVHVMLVLDVATRARGKASKGSITYSGSGRAGR